jgi:two-component system, chemotaxis family, chemotaxis protein CheY
MKKRVLIVDDDPDTVHLVQTIVELEGYEVRSARNGAEALSVINDSYKPDLILLDLMMPVMDGWTFSRTVRQSETTRETPIIVLSGVHDIRRRVDGLPIDGYLAKPFDYDDLRVWFDRFLEARH